MLLRLYAPLQGLLDAGQTGWTRTEVWETGSHWVHDTGLTCLMKHHTPRWELYFTHQDHTLTLSLPRDRRPTSWEEMPHQDLRHWIQGLDVEPRQAVARSIAAWLVLHGKTGTHTITLHSGMPDLMAVRPETPTLLTEALVPLDLPHALKDVIEELWLLEPPPEHARYIFWSYSGARVHAPRKIVIHLPTTGHARVDLISSLSPELRDILAPDARAAS